MKTIDELNEITSLNSNAYIPVSSNEGGGVTTKYNLSSMDTKVTSMYNSIGDLPDQFSTSRNYYPGQLVSYQDKIYKFIQIHAPGEWNQAEVEKTGLFQEFQGLNEKVVVTISGLDSLENRTISVSVDGEPSPRILTTNSQGQAETMITKGSVYSVYPQLYGNYVAQNYLDIKASLSERYLNISYLYRQSETCTLEVSIIPAGPMSTIEDFIGATFTIYSNNQQAIGAVIDNNGTATFENLVKYTTYTLNSTGLTPTNNSATYKKPTNTTTILSLPTNIVNLEYAKFNNSGFFLVNGNTWEETEITPEFIDTLDPTDTTLKDTYVAIHVCPKVLLDINCDYYVRCRDLTSERLSTEVTSKQWSTSNIFFPNVSTNTTNEYNGRKQTYYMIYDSTTLGIQSPAAKFAISQSFHGMAGFIGTRGQMDIIYGNTSNRNLVRSALVKLGYSNINYFNSINTCSSIQSGVNCPFFWSSAGIWSASYLYTTSYFVVPFFAIP